MGRTGESGKLPFAPWADHDHPEADEDEDARWKWGLTENYVDGDTVALAEDDHRLAGRVFLQQADDPYGFVDGDDVRCPETGEVHPAFVEILEQLGATYTDVSTSGSGCHANYQGTLPEGQTQATFALDDESWGANDDVPEVEIYTGKHVCVLTGEHVPGTPTDVNPWNDEALRTILADHNCLPTPREDIAGGYQAFDPADYDASATTSDETTDDIRDVFAALDRLDARRVAGDTIVHRWNDDASTSAGHRAFVPIWGRSANGTANVVNDQIWQDTGGGGYGGPVTMALIDLGELSPRTAQPSDARGVLWFQGIEHLRALDYDIPEYVSPDEDTEHVSVLPNSPKARATSRGFDWTSDARTDDALTTDEARQRTREAIEKALDRCDHTLVEALPTLGKSYGSIAAAANTETPVTVLTGRGNKEQYAQFEQWADEHGLTSRILPAFTRDCPTANGEHGEEWKAAVMDFYRRGATPKDIHAYAEDELGRPLPCQEHEGQECPYSSKWRFDPDEHPDTGEPWDVLIGHYAHAHRRTVTQGRSVILDEFPGGAYETTFSTATLPRAVTTYLQGTPGLPFDDYADLMDGRGEGQCRADALAWFDEDDLNGDWRQAFRDGGHALAPLAVFTLLAGATNDLGNGWERAVVDERRVGLYNREEGEIRLLQPPDLSTTRGTIALDGTPTQRMWELSLGTRLNHRPVLSEPERVEYIADALNLNLIRTTDWVKPYNSSDHVNVDRDAALLEGITQEHGERPSVITTSTAEEEYVAAGITERDGDGQIGGGLIASGTHYGNVLGSNEYKHTRLGAVIGSNHYGDDYIQKWGGYAGEDVPAGADARADSAKGTRLSYGAFGDEILTHMREHETLQAAMRFGRDGNGAVVYVHTNTLPEWVPVAGEGRVVTTRSDGERQVVEALQDLDAPRTRDVTHHPAVDVGQRQVLTILSALVDRGVLHREQSREDGRAFVWRDDGLHRLAEHGDVDLDTVALVDLADAKVDELARMSITYTWEFVNFAGSPPLDRDGSPVVAGESSSASPDGGGLPSTDVG
ncbi:hypothetical protein [Halomarina ordinaria]|uniref:Uncharacterized protein n=1 Tax=Halomarina ordinaria TaxID=3033939 RepID=A0ABD5UFM8_9EURY|nr:hypothetical protein [Halomarina sp. PSRA2]